MQPTNIAILFILLISLAFCGSPASFSFQGTDVINKSTGNVLAAGDLNISVWDNQTGGNLIYSEFFPNAILNGSWNIMLGENKSNQLNLTFGNTYYIGIMINGEPASFTDDYGNVTSLQPFQSSLGDLNISINGTGGINGNGTFNQIPLWLDNTTLGMSIMNQSLDNSTININGNLYVVSNSGDPNPRYLVNIENNNPLATGTYPLYVSQTTTNPAAIFKQYNAGVALETEQDIGNLNGFSEASVTLINLYGNYTSGMALGSNTVIDIQSDADFPTSIFAQDFDIENSGKGTLGNVSNGDFVAGVLGQVNNNNGGTIDASIGMAGNVNNYADSTINIGVGVLTSVSNYGTGHIDSDIGMIIRTPDNTGGGTIGNLVGLDIGDQSGIATGQGLNILSEGANSQNTFEGNVTVENSIQSNNYVSSAGNAGITDSSSFWMCKDAACSTTCQVQIENGLIVGCV